MTALCLQENEGIHFQPCKHTFVKVLEMRERVSSKKPAYRKVNILTVHFLALAIVQAFYIEAVISQDKCDRCNMSKDSMASQPLNAFTELRRRCGVGWCPLCQRSLSIRLQLGARHCALIGAVDHPEPPAIIDPDEASAIVDEQWASTIEGVA